MTDSHIHGENNPAYIEDLLSRLRESIGQETPTSCESVEQEGVLNSPIAEEETLTIDAPVEDVLEGVAMEESEAPVEEELEIPVTEEVAEEPAEDVVMEVLEEISEPAEEIVLEDTVGETAEEETQQYQSNED